MKSSDNKDPAKLAIALAQLNPHLGNVKSNTEKLITAHFIIMVTYSAFV